MGHATAQSDRVESAGDYEKYVGEAHPEILEPLGISAGFAGCPALVTVVDRDSPGLLHSCLTALGAEGYSVLASMTAAHADVGTVAIVATRPDDTVGVEALRRAVTEAVLQVSPDVRVEVAPVGGPDEGLLFKGRSFGEVRFGPLQSDGSASSDEAVAETVALALQQFAEGLGAERIPIAYFDIGHRWAPETTGQDASGLWVRIAFAMPPGVGDQVLPEMIAYEVGRDLGLNAFHHVVHKPGGRFSDDFRPLYRAPIDAVATSIRGATNAVVVEGVARTGFIADLLVLAQRELAFSDRKLRIFGGSMMVLHGRSVVCLLCDHESSEAIERSAASIEKRRSTSKTVVSQAADPSTPLRRHSGVDLHSAWIAWRCRDDPGVFLAILNCLGDVRKLGDNAHNVAFAISRVLRHGETCAGKLKVTWEGEHPILSHADVLLERLHGAVAPHLKGWSPPKAWLEQPIVVGDHEPVAEPWASLDSPDEALD